MQEVDIFAKEKPRTIFTSGVNVRNRKQIELNDLTSRTDNARTSVSVKSQLEPLPLKSMAQTVTQDDEVYDAKQ
jgi:hypothetical protein